MVARADIPFTRRLPAVRMGLIVKLILLVLIVSLPLLLCQVIEIRMRVVQHIQREMTANQELADATGTAFRNYVDNLWNTELALGSAIVQYGDRLANQQIAELLREQLIAHPTVVAFTWVAADGTVLVSTHARLAGVSLAAEPYFRQIAAGGNTVLSDLATNPWRVGYSFVVARAIRRNGTLLGVLVAEVDAERLGVALPVQPKGKRTFGLIDRQARLAFRSNFPDHPDRQLTEDTPGYLAATTLQPVIIPDSAKRLSAEQMSAYLPIHRLGWVAFATMPTDEVWAMVWPDIRLSVLVLLGATALSILGAVLVSRDLLNRLKAMRQASQALAEGNLDTRINLTGHDELTEASKAFNAMAERIQSAEMALREHKDRLAGIVETALDGILFINRTGEITFANPGAEKILGLDRNLICQRTYNDPSWRTCTVEGQPIPPEEHPLAQVVAQERPFSRLEYGLVRPDGERIIISMNAAPVHSTNGEITGIVASFREITRRKMYEQQLSYLASHDALTGLYNRRCLQEKLEFYLSHDGQGAVLFIDLDQFKVVNDRLGHAKGDELLCRIAATLRAQVGPNDMLARLGGDEFAVIVPDADKDAALALGERILAAMQRCSVTIEGLAVPATASIGVVLYPEHGRTAKELLSRVDLAMYQAKESGRNRTCLFSPAAADRQNQAEHRLAWEERMRQALAENRFVLHAQPVYDLQTNRVTLYELLLRLQDEHGNLVPPQVFLPIAEQSDLIHTINRWVVQQAIAMLAAHRDAEFSISVNLSAQVLSDMQFVRLIRSSLKEAGIDPHRLVLEITETAAITDTEQARRFIRRLRATGCRFALDDFGAGFTSLTYFRRLPIDYIKLDGSFIRDLVRSEIDQMLVPAITKVAQNLGLKVIAEFVEDAEVLAYLRRYGVDYAQGYFIGQPAAAHDTLSSATYKELSTAAIKGESVPE